MTALDEAFAAVDPDPEGSDTPEFRQSFRITGLETASWAMRKLAGVEAKRAEIRDFVLSRIATLEQFAASQDESLARDAAYFEGLLGHYVLSLRAASPVGKDGEPSVKSLRLPEGVVATRVSGGGWTASPDAVDWAESAHPDLVEVTKRLKVAEMRRMPGMDVVDGHVVDMETGAVVPGISVAARSVVASVRLDGVDRV